MVNFELKFEAIGTSWEIEIQNHTLTSNQKIKKAIFDLIEDFDLAYSRFNKNSTIFKASKKAGPYNLPEHSKKLFKVYQELYKISDKLFTPLIGDTLNSAGYDAKYSFKKKPLVKPHLWEETFKYSFPELYMKSPSTLDFGAAGKGYLIDLISELLLDFEIRGFSINAGGDIMAKNKELIIGLENPLNTKQVIGTIKLNNQSISSSSGNRRKWHNFHHIINPEKLTSPDKILASWVIADEAIVSDALSTAIFLMDPGFLKTKYDFEYLILLPNYSIQKSLHFNAELFYDK